MFDQNTMVKVNPEYYDILHEYPFTKYDRFIFLGYTKQMREHCTVVRIIDGRVFANYHDELFIELDGDEV